MHAAHGQSGRAGDRVLLSDTDVEDAVRIGTGELRQASRVQHGRGDRHDVRTLGADHGELVTEYLGSWPAGGLTGCLAVACRSLAVACSLERARGRRG